MKKIYLLSLILLCSTVVFSQNKEGKKPISWGVRLGANISIPEKYDYSQDDWEASQQGGIYLENRLLNSSFFNMRGELSAKMTRVGIYSGASVRTLSVELPVSLHFLPKIRKRNIGVFAGLAPSVPVFSDWDFGRITKFTPPINLGYFAGVSILFPSNKNVFGVDFRYCGYFADNYAYRRCSKGGGCYTNSNKLSTVELAITYRFW